MSAFGNLVSFGGASVAENAYFVNGFNISNFRNGLDPASVPFELYNDFEIKTGAYSAEFGRSTGGVINTTTKSGSNEYKAGANFYYSPDAGRWNSPDVWYVNDAGASTPYIYNKRDYAESWQANAYASGPLWKNRVFFYGLYQLRDATREDVTTRARVSPAPTPATRSGAPRSTSCPSTATASSTPASATSAAAPARA